MTPPNQLQAFSNRLSECGLACLAMVLGHHGHVTDLSALRRRFSVSLKGTTMKTIALMGQRLGLAHLKDLKLPAILHWDMNHFVVLAAVTGDRVTIHDPAKRGGRRMAR
ncbi:cysteine peptidase family C39 domain-containing protein [Rhodocista pekingensis]|uniref:Cysteine peptidase family C39 domain-containing protein n=1 Tax=Rhodocista pekingensis TaxID=201185 RepID=A0ABW2KTS2_9PROT